MHESRSFDAQEPGRWPSRWWFALAAAGAVPLLALPLVIKLAQASGGAETLTFEAFAVTPASERERLAGGALAYDVSTDLIVQEAPREKAHWTKSIVLEGDFAISADIYREPKVCGFGLFIQRPNNSSGFSWEWFDLERDNIFAKRQGSGRVAVTLHKASGLEELQSIEFLDDIVLRYLDDMKRPPGTHTHEVVVRAGSVLRLIPQNEPSGADAVGRLASHLKCNTG